MTAQDLIAFESSVAREFNEGRLCHIIHLSGGNEENLIEIFKGITEDDWVFSTWRSHYHYLLKGGNSDELMRRICNGDSMHIIDKDLKFFSSSIVAGCCPIATGVALSLKRECSSGRVFCFIGDGAEAQGVFYESVRYVDAHDLPCKFIIEDNGLSVDTPTSETLPAEFPWPACVGRYRYERKYPHCQTGLMVKEYM